MEPIEKDHYTVLTVKDAADFLRLSEMTILRLANAGVLPGAKVGRQWRFPKDGILNLIKKPEMLKDLQLKE
jgi:excisionase family DNA binding protein